MKKIAIFIFTLLLIGPFSIQAVTEEPEFHVTIYDGKNFTGDSYTIKAEMPDLSVAEYYETVYKPPRFPDIFGKYTSQKTSFNDKTSSVKYNVPAGYTVTMYAARDYGGANVTLSGEGEIADLSSRGFDNVMSSIELNQDIPHMPQITLYNDGNGCYCQGSVVIDKNVRNLEQYKFNDKTSAFKITNPDNGYPVIISFYNAANYEGFAYSVKLEPGEKFDMPQVPASVNETISSIKIEKYTETLNVSFMDSSGIFMNVFQGYVSEFRRFEFNDRPVRTEGYNPSATTSYKLNYYTAENYTGDSKGIMIYPQEHFIANVPSELVGQVSSYAAIPYTSPEITLYDNHNLTGGSYPFMGDIDDFKEFDNKTSSIYMYNPSFTTFEVTFYSDKNYQYPMDTKIIYPMETLIFNPTVDNSISSVKSVPAEGPEISLIDNDRIVAKIPQGSAKALDKFDNKVDAIGINNKTNKTYDIYFYNDNWSDTPQKTVTVQPGQITSFTLPEVNKLSSIKSVPRP